tara:strand:+ start:5193 stop:5822 length:630 start_codon:yes stop_codon:yes gene_type:complete
MKTTFLKGIFSEGLIFLSLFMMTQFVCSEDREIDAKSCYANKVRKYRFLSTTCGLAINTGFGFLIRSQENTFLVPKNEYIDPNVAGFAVITSAIIMGAIGVNGLNYQIYSNFAKDYPLIRSLLAQVNKIEVDLENQDDLPKISSNLENFLVDTLDYLDDPENEINNRKKVIRILQNIQKDGTLCDENGKINVHFRKNLILTIRARMNDY